MSEHSVYICVEGVCKANGLPKDSKVNCGQSKSVSCKWRNERRKTKEG